MGDDGGGEGAVLSDRPAGGPIVTTVAETGSTNADLLAAAAEGAPEGAWLRAERQHGGRGRLGRAWQSPAGNLYASTIVRLRAGDPAAPGLALVAGVALEEAAGAFVAPGLLRLKWPNDLTAGNAKLAGILLERAGDAVVIGFGVNLARGPAGLDRPVTSIAALAGRAPDPATFLEALAAVLARWIDRWRSEGLGPVRARWLERAHPRGTPLIVTVADAAMEGLFEELDESGALVLRRPDGTRATVHAGDVFLV